MNNSLAIGKKALVITVAAATILWTLGLTAFAPAQVSAASFGDLIKGETLGTVYYYGSDGMRYSFPNEKTFFSWYENFDGVVTMSDDDLADIALGGNIVYRSGTRWVKITSDNKTYAVSADGSLHWIESEEVAVGLAGDNWNTFIDDVPDVLFSIDYTIGDSLSDASSGYEGMLWSDGTHNYLITGGESKMVSEAGMSANNYQSGSVLSGSGVMLSGLVSGSNIESEMSNLTDTAQMVETETYTASSEVSVMLEAMPATTTLIAGQALADMARLTISNNSNSDASLTGLTLARTGVSADATLANIYLFNGSVRVTDAATVSDSKVQINDAGGIVSVPAGGSVSLSVRSDIAAATNGQTIGVSLAAAADVTFSGSVSATGSFPMSGAIHTIAATPATFAAVDFTGATTPALASVDPQDGYRLWERAVAVTNNEVDINVLRLRNIGSIDATDVGNWKFYVSGVMYGSAVAQEDADGYITFDLSDSPVRLNTGSHTLKVVGDIIAGSNRTITAGLRNAADIMIVDSDYNQSVLTTVGAAAFSAMDAGAQTVNQGSLTFIKATDSPSGDVTETASAQSLAKYTVKAFGEDIKVESLEVFVDYTDGTGAGTGDATVSLRNVALYADGVQVGSTATLPADPNGGTVATYTLGSSMIVSPGSPVTLEVKGDIFDNEGAEELEATDTLQIVINAPGSNNAQRVESGSFFQTPTNDVLAGTTTVAVGTLTVAKNTSYADQTVVAPLTAFKVGSWSLTAGTTEDINITSFDVDFDADDDGDAALATADYTDLYIEYGPEGSMTTSSTKGTVGVANSWSINHLLAKGETIYLNAYANVDSSVTDSADNSDFIGAELDATFSAADSATSTPAIADVVGQVITYRNAGTLTTSVDGSSKVARIVAAGQEVEAARYRFRSENDSYTIKELTAWVNLANGASAISELRFYDGDTLLGSAPMALNQNTDGDGADVANTAGKVTGLSLEIPPNSYKIITAKLLLNDIGTGAGFTQQELALTLDHVKATNGQGADASDTNARAGNSLRAYKSVPTVTHVDLSNSTLVNGQAVDLYKFTVTASSNGSIALKQLALPMVFSDQLGAGPDGDGDDVLEFEFMKLYKNGSDISTNSAAVALQDSTGANVEDATGMTEDADDAEVLYIIWDTDEEVVSAGETVTYTIRGTPADFNSDGDVGETDSMSLYLAGDAIHNSDGGTAGGTEVCLADTGNGDIWQLDSTAGEAVAIACTAGDVGETAANFIWSDMSSSGHDATETTGSDWANGNLILNLDLDGEVWSK